MAKKIIWFFGINGVGKSSLIRKILERSDGLKIQAIFQTLMDVMGVSSRSELEKIEAVIKYELLEKALFKKSNDFDSSVEYVLIDCHLMVPIRKNGLVYYECMWSNKFINFSHGVYMLTADPYEILRRRTIDKDLSGRERDLNLENIHRDQETNKIMLNSLLKPILPTTILETTNISIEELAENILRGMKKERLVKKNSICRKSVRILR